MHELWGLLALSFVFFFDSPANALQCAQGTRLTGGVDTITNAECANSTHICHRIDFSVSVGGITGKNYFYNS